MPPGIRSRRHRSSLPPSRNPGVEISLATLRCVEVALLASSLASITAIERLDQAAQPVDDDEEADHDDDTQNARATRLMSTSGRGSAPEASPAHDGAPWRIVGGEIRPTRAAMSAASPMTIKSLFHHSLPSRIFATAAVRAGVQVSGRPAQSPRLSFRSGRLDGRLDHRVQLTRKALADGLKGDVGLGLAEQVDQRDHRAQFGGPHYFARTTPFARMQSARWQPCARFLTVIVTNRLQNRASELCPSLSQAFRCPSRRLGTQSGSSALNWCLWFRSH